MGTTDIRVTVSDTEHERLREQKGDNTWRDAIRAGCEVLADE